MWFSKVIKMLLISKEMGHLPFVAIWVGAIMASTYMIASGFILESDAAQIAAEVRDLLGFPSE